jgi:hypothetical protein
MARLISNINDNRIRYVVPVEISSSLSITGSLLTTAGITGSIQGTASFATTASYALNAGTTINTSSLATTGSNNFVGNQTISGSLTARQTGFNASGIFIGDTIGAILLSTTASNGFSVFTFGGAFQIYDNTNAATRFTLSSGGDISVNGITTSNDVKITGSLSTKGIFSVGNTTTTNSVIQRAQAPAGSYSFIFAGGTGLVDTYPYTMADTHAATMELRAGDPTTDQYGGGIIFSANGHTSPLGEGNAVIFKTRSGVNTYSEKMRISSNGVGIGTNAPNAVLHVDGTVRIDNQTGTPLSPGGSAGVVNQYWGTEDGVFLSTPTVWLKINIGGSDYYFPGYE